MVATKKKKSGWKNSDIAIKQEIKDLDLYQKIKNDEVMKSYIIPENQKKLRKAAIEKRECWTKKKLQASSRNDRSKSDPSRAKIDG